jgi:carbonic anhydrase
VTQENPQFFSNLAAQQNPDFLWIGCSDSRVTANTIVGLMPGEVFVHRNVANLVIHTDINCLSVLQFAVEVLTVKHIIVCGHYGCGGIQAAVDGHRHGLIDNWLRHIKDTANLHSNLLDSIHDPTEKLDKLAELNVAEQVLNVGETTIVSDAWDRGQPLEIHGWIYGLKDGLLRDLEISIANETRLRSLRSAYLFNDKRDGADGASN